VSVVAIQVWCIDLESVEQHQHILDDLTYMEGFLLLEYMQVDDDETLRQALILASVAYKGLAGRSLVDPLPAQPPEGVTMPNLRALYELLRTVRGLVGEAVQDDGGSKQLLIPMLKVALFFSFAPQQTPLRGKLALAVACMVAGELDMIFRSWCRARDCGYERGHRNFVLHSHHSFVEPEDPLIQPAHLRRQGHGGTRSTFLLAAGAALIAAAAALLLRR
jgi:hypothetical protein